MIRAPYRADTVLSETVAEVEVHAPEGPYLRAGLWPMVCRALGIPPEQTQDLHLVLAVTTTAGQEVKVVVPSPPLHDESNPQGELPL